METGVVRWFSEARGYGFIEPTTAEDAIDTQKPLYFHHADIIGRGYRSLQPGQAVRYQRQQAGGATRAVEVEAL